MLLVRSGLVHESQTTQSPEPPVLHVSNHGKQQAPLKGGAHLIVEVLSQILQTKPTGYEIDF